MNGPAIPRIALLPLDDRPVNVLLPQDVARVAGIAVDIPPADILPRYREPGDVCALGEWLRERADDPSTVHLVVSLDMLVYGGLIASRTSDDSARDCLARLDLLRELRQAHPGLRISAVSLVMRASDSYSAAEEPDYWESYGREIHRLGAEVHRQDRSSQPDEEGEARTVPPEVITDFVARRVRNHIVNLQALVLAEEDVIDFLAVTADDTAEFSAGSAEQDWLRHWMRFAASGTEVLMYPGADEVGAILVARALSAAASEPVTFRMVCAEEGGLDRIPPYENQPMTESIRRQVLAAGARIVDSNADVELIVHAPDPARHDMFGGYPERDDESAIAGTIDALRGALSRGRRAALADVRYPNGADAALMLRLSEEGMLASLTAFGGWNTAGNTLGSVVAVAVAAVVGGRTGQLDQRAVRQALLTRLLDDWVYQSVIRTEDGPSLFADDLPVADDRAVRAAEEAIARRMTDYLATRLPADGWRLSSLRLPWRRSFEVEIGLEPDAERAGG